MIAARAWLRVFLRERSGISLGPDKDYLIDSRVGARLSEWGVRDLVELTARLRADPDGPLAAAIVETLTTHETSWFRDHRPFQNLRGPVLDAIRASNAASRRLSIWSAACSTGQEAYSIAIVLQEQGFVAPDWQVSILASDISQPVLERARAGEYSEFELWRGLDPEQRRRYFTKTSRGWRASDSLRQALSFRRINLLDIPPDIGGFDIVFCRNVLIYFERDMQARVLSALHTRLRPGGFLFLGTAESPLGLVSRFSAGSSGSGLYRADS